MARKMVVAEERESQAVDVATKIRVPAQIVAQAKAQVEAEVRAKEENEDK